MWNGRGETAIAGIGRSAVVRNVDTPLSNAVLEACTSAVSDAGLAMSSIDGLATYPSLPYHGAQELDGYNFVSVPYVLDHLNVGNVKWYSQISEGMAASAIVEAVNALLADSCEYVLVWRALSQPKGTYGARDSRTAVGEEQFTAPYGFSSIAQGHAVAYMRYMEEFGATREQMATLVVNSRHNASLNAYAYFNEAGLSMAEYLDSRWISEPLCLYDCDIPVQGCVAMVITRADRAKDLMNPPAYILGWAQQSLRAKPSIAYMLNDHMEAGGHLATQMWERAGVSASEVDVAELYDGFSPTVYYWLESAGFCGRGEAHDFIQNGRIALDGELPVNTFGGSLSEGRLHGMGHVAEAALQVSGRAADRQVDDANVAVAMTGSPLLRSAGLVVGAEV